MLEGVIPPETFPPPCGVALRRTCRCTEFHRVKNANLRHPSAMCCVKPFGPLPAPADWLHMTVATSPVPVICAPACSASSGSYLFLPAERIYTATGNERWQGNPRGTDECFHSNTKLQIWNLTWCMGLYFVRTHTVQTAAFGSFFSILYRRCYEILRLVTYLKCTALLLRPYSNAKRQIL